MDPASDASLLPNPALLPNAPALDVHSNAENVVLSSALDTLRGPAPLLKACANYKAISQPTLLRSERRQAGKKEYVTSCTGLEEILEQALGISESLPVPPAQIISGIRDIQEECQKRKQGKPIPPEDLIDLTNESNNEDFDKSTQVTSASKSLPKQSPHSSPLVGQYKPDHLCPAEDAHDAPLHGKIDHPDAASQTLSHTTGASESSSAKLTGPASTNNPALPPATGPQVNPNLPHDSLPTPSPANPTNSPLLKAPPAPMITLLSLAANTGSAHPSPSDQTHAPSTSTSQPSPISFIKDKSIRSKVHVILKNFQGNINHQKFTAAHNSVHSFLDCQEKSMHKRTLPPDLPQFSLVQAESTHKSWLKEIQKHLGTILLPGNNEPWFAPELIDISQIQSANLKDLKASSHVKFSFALLLWEIQKPSKLQLS
ncbi:hypothetical protein PTTG_08786 [Puccinia triticina 1-1 BBBD Race 1]|uniref:Uncharacterized protein n=1 Tax=Puccinia triticina (isolate 1-1 / race 1 (BBBD)) TaxID=630390 RepID=A0A180G7Y2_PUCT1|nr:hypothetical protein PTTG_08786 [Puccinia triticina 1-1 BBBD Race 1]